MSSLNGTQLSGQVYRLLKPINTPAGPSQLFVRLDPELYEATSLCGLQHWQVTLEDLRRLNPDKAIEASPTSTPWRPGQEAPKPTPPRALPPSTPYSSSARHERDGYYAWFLREQRLANEREEEERLAWRRARARVLAEREAARVQAAPAPRSRPSRPPHPVPSTAEGTPRPVTSLIALARELREREDAETPRWMRPSFED